MSTTRIPKPGDLVRIHYPAGQEVSIFQGAIGFVGQRDVVKSYLGRLAERNREPGKEIDQTLLKIMLLKPIMGQHDREWLEVCESIQYLEVLEVENGSVCPPLDCGVDT